jgi:ABC-type antimicrobial peptide transport system permease subunit
VKTYEAQLADSLARERFQTALLVSFGAAALLLTMLGIYGVISYSVAARKQEIGVRMALGASRPSIYRLAMSHAAMPVGIGLGTGVLAGLFAGRVIEQFLFGARAVEPLVILAVAAVFLLCAALAGFLPALRAASVDPVRALRAE